MQVGRISCYIAPSDVSGEIVAPPSKSFTIRAIAAAMLAGGRSVIVNPSLCDDSLAALRVAESLGAGIESVLAAGREPAARGQLHTPFGHERAVSEQLPGPLPDRLVLLGGGAPRSTRLDCGESGLVLRMFSAIAALREREFTLSARGTLRRRPVGMVRDLERLGVVCTTRDGLPPVRVCGPLKGGKLKTDASISSQFLSGLLMALPVCDGDSEIRVSGLKSRGYAAMTLAVMKDFGVHVRNCDFRRFIIPGRQRYVPCTYVVEGDWSGAAFMLVAGAVAGRVKVTGLNVDSLQPDRAVLSALERAGAAVRVRKKAVYASKKKLRPFQFDVSECPDLFPPLVVLAANCRGKSVIRGTARLEHKESDRVRAIVGEFARIGVAVAMRRDSVTIEGGRIEGGRIASHGDHRIAMAGAVAALTSVRGVTVDGARCVAKSYPAFFTDLARGVRLVCW